MSTAAAVKPSLTIRRRFKAAPARVFAAWTEPAQIARWFGPGGVKVTEAIFELHVGGRFMVHGTSPSGEDDRVSGTVQEVVPGRKVVYSWAWQSTPERQSLVIRTSGNGSAASPPCRAGARPHRRRAPLRCERNRIFYHHRAGAARVWSRSIPPSKSLRREARWPGTRAFTPVFDGPCRAVTIECYVATPQRVGTGFSPR
jgi:uncharacterized protein YndB with AHSA1/START domain